MAYLRVLSDILSITKRHTFGDFSGEPKYISNFILSYYLLFVTLHISIAEASYTVPDLRSKVL